MMEKTRLWPEGVSRKSSFRGILLCGFMVLALQGIANGLTVSDSFDTSETGDSLSGRLTEVGGSTWMVNGGTAAVIGSDGAVSSNGSSASQATIALRSRNVYQNINIVADVLISSSDDYISLAYCPTTNCTDDWNNLGLPSLRLYPSGNWVLYGLSSGTISGFTPNVYHEVELQYHFINKNVKFYLDDVLIQDQYVWQSWTNWPQAVGFRINNTTSGLSKIDNFCTVYTSDIASFPVVSKNEFSVAKESGSEDVIVSNGGEGVLSWTAASDSGWLTVTPTSGTDTGTVTLSFSENTTYLLRTGIITITGNGQTATITVVQAGVPKAAASLTVNVADDEGTFDSNIYMAQGGVAGVTQASFWSSITSMLSALGTQQVRIDHIWDSYGIVSRDANDNLQYNWTSFDAVIEQILASGAKPFLCLSFMPSALNSSSTLAPPTSWADWQAINQALAAHMVSTWSESGLYYEVWNEPESSSFWTGTEAEAMELYRYAVTGVRAGDSSAKVGGFGCIGTLWLEDLLDFCEDESLPVDFLSWHFYLETFYHTYDRCGNSIRLVDGYLDDHNLTGVEMIMSEWNYNAAIDESNDSFYNAGFCGMMMDQFKENGLSKGFFFMPRDSSGAGELVGQWGAITAGGSPKPSYNFLQAYSNLVGQRVDVTQPDEQVKAFAVRDGDTLRILLWNFDQTAFFGETRQINLTVDLTGSTLAPGAYDRKIWSIDSTHSNVSYDANNPGLALVQDDSITMNATQSWSFNLENGGVQLITLTAQEVPNGLTVSDSFDTGETGDSLSGRLTEIGGSTWMVGGGTTALIGGDGAVSSGGLSGASQATFALRSPNLDQPITISADVFVSTSDDYVSLGYCPTSNCSDDWNNLGLPSLRLHPSGAWEFYGLTSGTISGFNPAVYHEVELKYYFSNKTVVFYLDDVMIKTQYVWQSWTNTPLAVGFRINSTTSGLSKIDNFSTGYTSSVASFPVVSKTDVSVSNESGSVAVIVSDGGQGVLTWTAASDSGWLTVSPASGTETGTLTITCTENTVDASRSGVITVTGNSQTATITVVQAGTSKLIVSDSFDTGEDGDSLSGRLTEVGGSTWMVNGGTTAEIGSDGAVSSGGLSGASQATFALRSPFVNQTINISADVFVSTSDDYVSLGYCPTSNGSDDWGNLGLPSLRLHPSGAWELYGLTSGTISGFNPAVYHEVELQYNHANKDVKFYLDDVLIQDQYVWQNWTNTPLAIGFRINSTTSGLSKIDNFSTIYASSVASFPVVSKTDVAVSNASGSVDVIVSDGGQGVLTWTAASDSSWLTLSSASGTETETLTLTYTANNTYIARTGIITITGNSQTATITVVQSGIPHLTISDSFDSGDVGDSLSGRVTEVGGSTWMLKSGTAAVIGSDKAVSSGGLKSASQASIALVTPNVYQNINVVADVFVSSSDDYVSLGYCPSSDGTDNWGNLGLPSLRLHPSGAWELYGLSNGTISGFNASIYHKIELQYHYINRNVKFYLDDVLIQDQYVWQNWTNTPAAVGFRMNSTASGLSKIDNFSFEYVSDTVPPPSGLSIRADENESTMCSSLGLSLVAGLALMGLMMVKLEE